MKKKIDAAYIEEVERAFAAASPSETAALVKKLNKLKRKFARSE